MANADEYILNCYKLIVICGHHVSKVQSLTLDNELSNFDKQDLTSYIAS